MVVTVATEGIIALSVTLPSEGIGINIGIVNNAGTIESADVLADIETVKFPGIEGLIDEPIPVTEVAAESSVAFSIKTLPESAADITEVCCALFVSENIKNIRK